MGTIVSILRLQVYKIFGMLKFIIDIFYFFLLFVSHFVRFAHLSEGSPILKARGWQPSHLLFVLITRIVSEIHSCMLILYSYACTQIRRNMLCVCVLVCVCPLLCSNYRISLWSWVYWSIVSPIIYAKCLGPRLPLPSKPELNTIPLR